MSNWKTGMVWLFASLFILGMGIPQVAEAKKAAKVLKDPDAPTDEEAKVLGWGPVKTPNRAKRPEYLIRGVLLDIQEVKDAEGKTIKNNYTVAILPIEVLENHQREITFDHFNTGFKVDLMIPKPKMDELKKGKMLEFHQYYTVQTEQEQGAARMVAFVLHQDIQGYPAGAGAYLKKPEFYPVQYKNAIKGVQMDSGDIKGDEQVKAHLDHLATTAKDPELKESSRVVLMEIYQIEPTGKCKLDKTTQLFACQ